MAEQFGKYSLLSCLGRGGMAEVFLARARSTQGYDRLLAIKRLLPPFNADKQIVSMLADEARVSVWLNHPNIVQILDFGRVGSTYYIAMEYVQGCDLCDLVRPGGRRQGRPMPVPTAINVMLQVADALDYAHRRRNSSGESLQIIHRDVSPHNVLISQEGQVKLADFGLARATISLHMSHAGVIRGKFSYMPKEQAHGRDIDHRIDLFAAGATLYEALTGVKPYTSTTLVEQLYQLEQPVPPPSAHVPDVPEAVDIITMQALCPDPEGRYQTAADLANDLRDVLGQLSTSVEETARLAGLVRAGRFRRAPPTEVLSEMKQAEMPVDQESLIGDELLAAQRAPRGAPDGEQLEAGVAPAIAERRFSAGEKFGRSDVARRRNERGGSDRYEALNEDDEGDTLEVDPPLRTEAPRQMGKAAATRGAPQRHVAGEPTGDPVGAAAGRRGGGGAGGSAARAARPGRTALKAPSGAIRTLAPGAEADDVAPAPPGAAEPFDARRTVALPPPSEPAPSLPPSALGDGAALDQRRSRSPRAQVAAPPEPQPGPRASRQPLEALEPGEPGEPLEAHEPRAPVRGGPDALPPEKTFGLERAPLDIEPSSVGAAAFEAAGRGSHEVRSGDALGVFAATRGARGAGVPEPDLLAEKADADVGAPADRYNEESEAAFGPLSAQLRPAARASREHAFDEDDSLAAGDEPDPRLRAAKRPFDTIDERPKDAGAAVAGGHPFEPLDNARTIQRSPEEALAAFRRALDERERRRREANRLRLGRLSWLLVGGGGLLVLLVGFALGWGLRSCTMGKERAAARLATGDGQGRAAASPDCPPCVEALAAARSSASRTIPQKAPRDTASSTADSAGAGAGTGGAAPARAPDDDDAGKAPGGGGVPAGATRPRGGDVAGATKAAADRPSSKSPGPRPRPARTPETRPSPASSSEPAGSPNVGYLSITATAPGRVYIDDSRSSVPLPVQRMPLSPGIHRVRIYFEATRSFSDTQWVSISAGQHAAVSFTGP